MKKLIFLCMLATGCSPPSGQLRESLPLSGTWAFRIDPTDEGISGHWYDLQLEGEIGLPGSMAENGLGFNVSAETEWTGDIIDSSWYTSDAYEPYRQPGNLKIPFWLQPVKYYKGAAWYQREVTLPESWKEKRVFLVLERPHWETTVYVNGMEAGREESLSTPHQYDISPWVEPGRNRISIRVDNREIIPVGRNSHSISDHTQSNWNGIAGKLFLETRNNLFISDIQVYPDLGSSLAELVVTLENHAGKPFTGKMLIRARSENTGTVHEVPSLTSPVSLTGKVEEIRVSCPMGRGALLWSEFSPAVYALEITITDAEGQAVDQRTVTFGMREFKAVGTRFQVNGRPVFLRGTLECCIFPRTGYPPTDLASWEHIMARCREHGLNHIRFHSWCPPEAAFMAADLAGIYLQVECASWANQGSSLGDGLTVDRFIYEEGDRIMKAYGNHPSFCMMAYGNEPAGEHQERYLTELLAYWKSKDRRRIYTAGAGWPLLPVNDYHNGPEPRIQHWGEGLRSIINSSAPQTSFDYREVISPYGIPFVSHEIGQWCVYPDFREMELYTGVLKPSNFEIFKASLEEHHMGDRAHEFLMASGKLQLLCYKADIEAALRTPGFAGFQLLQLHDFPGQGTALVGILDPFFNSKDYATPEEFRRFCNETVLLARMDQRIFRPSDTLRAGIEIAHFGPEPLSDVTVRCRITDQEDFLLDESFIPVETVPLDNAISLGEMCFPLERFTEAEKLTLSVSLEDTPFSNQWDFWVYPEPAGRAPGGILVTDRLDREAREVLSGGGSVLLLTEGKVKEGSGASIAIGFSSIFWNTAWTGGQSPHTLGILCDPLHPVFRGFPTEFHSNWQWWDPMTHSQAMILDQLPPELDPLIQPIHTWFENKKLGLLFEARAAGGKLMVCSINMTDEMERRPVSGQLLQSILAYMESGEFEPEIRVELHQVDAMLGSDERKDSGTE